MCRFLQEMNRSDIQYKSTYLTESLEKVYRVSSFRKAALLKRKINDVEASLEVIIANNFEPPMAFPNSHEKSYMILPDVSFLRKTAGSIQKFITLHEICHCIDYTLHYEALGKTYTFIYSLFVIFLSFIPFYWPVKLLVIAYFILFIFLRRFLYRMTFEAMVDIRALTFMNNDEIKNVTQYLIKYYDKELRKLNEDQNSYYHERFSVALRKSILKGITRIINYTDKSEFYDNKIIKSVKSINPENALKTLIKSHSENDILNFWFFITHALAFSVIIVYVDEIHINLFYLLVIVSLALVFVDFHLNRKRMNNSKVASKIYDNLEMY